MKTKSTFKITKPSFKDLLNLIEDNKNELNSGNFYLIINPNTYVKLVEYGVKDDCLEIDPYYLENDGLIMKKPND